VKKKTMKKKGRSGLFSINGLPGKIQKNRLSLGLMFVVKKRGLIG